MRQPGEGERPPGRLAAYVNRAAPWLYVALLGMLFMLQAYVGFSCLQSGTAAGSAPACGYYTLGIGSLFFLALGAGAWTVWAHWQKPLLEVTRTLACLQPGGEAPVAGALPSPGAPDARRLLASVQRDWNAVLQEVGHSGQDIDRAGQDLARQHASFRASLAQYADALHSTTAHIDSVVNSSLDGERAAELADTAANEAATNAVSGSGAVVEAVTAMQEIQESSRRISEITTLVDGIAFQTNILALNAAVEAARAGNQGRGFAVVAGEVRTLATRSAGAAREIKELIATSSERVQAGSQHFDRAGKSMELVMENLGNVITYIGEIKKAATEQHDKVRQICEEVQACEKGVEEHAALMQAFTGSIDELQRQAGQLQDQAHKHQRGA